MIQFFQRFLWLTGWLLVPLRMWPPSMSPRPTDCIWNLVWITSCTAQISVNYQIHRMDLPLMGGIMVCDKFTVEAEIFEGIEFRGLLYKKKFMGIYFLGCCNYQIWYTTGLKILCDLIFWHFSFVEIFPACKKKILSMTISASIVVPCPCLFFILELLHA